jgi:ubiquinone/menaquinone biosynthesis C-methylase UbiE
MKAYYEARAREYDDWYLGVNQYENRHRPGWEDELEELRQTIEALPPLRTLDVACGTGFLTRHLRGQTIGLDQSPSMIEVARGRVPEAEFVVGEALSLPFADGAFDRVFTGHFYGHLEEPQRAAFLREARRVARELVVVDSARNEQTPEEGMDERILSDGSRWEVYKRWLTGAGLAAELGGGDVLHEGRYFVVVRT